MLKGREGKSRSYMEVSLFVMGLVGGDGSIKYLFSDN